MNHPLEYHQHYHCSYAPKGRKTLNKTTTHLTEEENRIWNAVLRDWIWGLFRSLPYLGDGMNIKERRGARLRIPSLSCICLTFVRSISTKSVAFVFVNQTNYSSKNPFSW